MRALFMFLIISGAVSAQAGLGNLRFFVSTVTCQGEGQTVEVKREGKRLQTKVNGVELKTQHLTFSPDREGYTLKMSDEKDVLEIKVAEELSEYDTVVTLKGQAIRMSCVSKQPFISPGIGN